MTSLASPGTTAASTGTARESRTAAKQAAAIPLLAAGRSYGDVCAQVRVSKRNLVRWAAEPDFAARVSAARGRILEAVVGLLAGEAAASARTLAQLRDGAESEQVRLGACRSLLDTFMAARKASDLEDRMAEIERLVAEVRGAPRSPNFPTVVGAAGVA